MTETGRIRWEPTEYGGWTGHVGTIDGFVFQVWKPAPLGEKPWQLESSLPGNFGYIPFPRDIDPDKLKAEAECLLEEFVRSIGAVFPEPGFEFDDDGEPLEVTYAPGRRVRFEHPDYGYPGEPAHATEHLTPGEVYTIVLADIGQSKTDLLLEGIPDEMFNSVFFEPADDNETAATAGED